MAIIMFPFRFWAALPEGTLINRIRQESWNLNDIFKLLKGTKSDLRELKKSVKNGKISRDEINHFINSLSKEIRSGFKDLKLINFYDSAILYLYFRLLQNVFGLCEKEIARFAKEKKKELPKGLWAKWIEANKEKLEDIKKAKEYMENSIKKYEELINGLEIGERELFKAYQKLVKRLRNLRWKAEKRAQNEFSFEEITLRSMENLNRKIKIEPVNVKKAIPQKAFLMKKIQSQGEVNPKDVALLAKLASKAIDRISKDVSYSSKLISKFQKEMAGLKKDVENLKKTINKFAENGKIKITMEAVKSIMEPWDNAISYLEDEVHKDLMEIFRNIFVEYKYVATRQPEIRQRQEIR